MVYNASMNQNNDSEHTAVIAVAISQSSPKSAATLAAVHDQSWSEYFLRTGHPYEAPTNIALPDREHYWQQQLLLAEPRDLAVFQAERENFVVGFSVLKKQRSDNLAHIELLCVMPEHRRKHIGSSLLKHSIDYVRDHGFSKILVWTMEDDNNSIQFFESSGFRLDGAYRKYPSVPKQVRYAIAITPW